MSITAPKDPRPPHSWKMDTDVDGNPYKYCVRGKCGVIWSRAHSPNRPEPLGCKGEPTAEDRRLAALRPKQ